MSQHETALNPDAALKGAAKLTSVGDTLASQFPGLRSRIESINNKQPWGKDDVGNKFNEHYFKGTPHSPVDTMLNAAADLVHAIANLGPQVKEGVEGSQSLDELTSEWFKGGKS